MDDQQFRFLGLSWEDYRKARNGARETLTQTLDSANPVIGSIAQRGNPFIEKIKVRKDVLLVSVSEKNRDSLTSSLLEQIPTSTGTLKPA